MKTWNGIKTVAAWTWEYVKVAYEDVWTNTAFSTKVVLAASAAILFWL